MKNKYFVAYPLPEPLAGYHKTLTGCIAQSFKVSDVSKRVLPHLTLKAPFDVDAQQIEQVRALLKEFAGTHHSSNIRIEGFGSFARDVIYVDAQPSVETLQAIDELMQKLKTLSWLEFRPYDVPKKLHATLAMRDISECFDLIWRFVNSFEIAQDINFDGVTLLRYVLGKWQVVQSYPLLD